MTVSLICSRYGGGVTTEEATVVLLREWRKVSDAVERATESVLAGYGLSETAVAVLMILGECDSPPTMRDLAPLLGCDPSNVTLIATKLQGDALIEKRAHPTDGRSRVLILTSRGEATRSRILTELGDASPLGVLPPAGQQQLLDLLRRVTG
jgi:DNA-binding MarR family transcriptional regulator